MDPYPREKLAELVRGGDAGLVQDARRVRALLEDMCPDAAPEVAALVAAVEESIPIRIVRSSDSLSVYGGQERLARLLAQNRALTAGAAGWAVQSWAWILGKGNAPDDAAAAVAGDVPGPGMQAMPRERLRDLSRRYGPDLLEDPRRVKGLIQDVAPGHRREQAVLVAAAEEGIPKRIASFSAAVAIEGELGRQARTLAQRRALTDDAARWAVQSWAWALGKAEAPSDAAEITRPSDPSPEQAETRPPRPEAETGRPPPPPPPGPPPPRPGPPPGPPRRKRSGRLRVLAAVGVLVALVAVIVAANQGGGTTYYPPTDGSTVVTDPPATDPPETNPPETNPPETGGSSSALEEIQATFTAPSDSCQESTSNVPDGAELVLECSLPDADVRYMKWTSLEAMNQFFDQDKTATGYEEDGWYFDSTPDVTEGRLIEFEYDDGSRGLDWTYEDKLLSGEAKRSGTQEELKDWWRKEG